MSLEEIVNVQITRETQSVSRASFSIINVVGLNVNSPTRISLYTSLSGVKDAVTGGLNAPEYKAAQAIFSQNPSVTTIALGAIQSKKVVTFTGTYTAGSIAATINGTEITEAYDTDKDTTLGNLATSIQALSDVLTAVYAADILTITPAAGKVLSVSIDVSSITGTMVAVVTSTTNSESIADSLDAMKEENNSWYGLILVDRTDSVVASVAAWVEANDKFFVTASADSTIIGGADTSSIAYDFKQAAYVRTAVIYHSLAGTQYADAALLGKILPYDPGTYTAKFKTLAGITVDNLTPTQSTSARSNNANTYEEFGDRNIIREGTVAEGEFIDIIIFIDWLKARMTEDVYATLVRNLKVPFDSSGLATIQNAMEQSLQTGQNRGAITQNQFDEEENQIAGYYIILPAIEDVPTADKIARTLNDVKFTAYLSGAIHAVEINGIVTV